MKRFNADKGRKHLLLYYIILMTVIIVVMPLLIVKGCTQPFEAGEPKTHEGGVTINVYLASQKRVVKVYLEEYLKGVVAAEMPASYEIEALKAQAVAARTYALGRAEKLYTSPVDLHEGADVCTDPGHCQAWMSKDTAMKRWGLLSSFKYWNKISKAVNDTAGQVLEYDNVLINPLFHSNSGGRTENVEDVWLGKSVPYLISVESPGEDQSSEYKKTVEYKTEEMAKILKENYPDIELSNKDFISNISIQKYSEGGRVIDMKIGNVTMKGTEFRKLFQLRSTNFKLEKLSDGKIAITAIGYGHGVGMSQCGANAMALNKKSYSEILKHYYTESVQIKLYK